MEKVKKALTLDGWNNVLTSIGIKGKDKRMSATVNWERGTREKFENFYAGDDIAGKIVDIVPEEALSKGYKITGIEDKKTCEKVEARLTQLKFNDRILEAWRLSRIHGGAGIIKITEDAQLEQMMPNMKKILALNVVDRWDLFCNSTDIDGQITSPTYKDPLRYSLQVSEGNASTFLKIHGSRVVRFDGAFLPRRLMRTNQYWGDSILSKLENPIRNYQISNDAAALTIQDFDIPVLKMKNLAELMSSSCDDQVIKRLEMVNLSKSIAKMIVLDADKEDFEHKGRNVTGMKDVLDKIEARLVTAANMPRTKLFGESSGGLGSTGEHESTNWYDYIESQQSNYLKPRMLDIIKHIIMTEFQNLDVSLIDIEFTPLWQESEKEEADRKKVIAETDAIYVNAGIVDVNEVALSRWGGEKFSDDMVIDVVLREQNPITQEDIDALKIPPPEPIPAEPVVEKKPAVEVQDLKEIKDQQATILNKIEKFVTKKQPKTSDIVLVRGKNYDTEIDMKDRNGEKLDLSGYEFDLEIRDDNNAIIEKYPLTKTSNLGHVLLSFPENVVSTMLSFKTDSDDSVFVNASVIMTRPNGTKKTVKQYSVRADE